MNNGKENPIIINYKDYPQRKNSSPLLQNIPKKLYFRKHLSFEKLNENENIIKKPKKSIFYYKNPKFFNEMNINTQLNFLRKLSYENKMKDEYTQKYDSLSDKNLFPKLKRNNTESLDTKLDIDYKTYINKNKLKLTTKKKNYFNRANTEENENYKKIKNHPKKSTEKFYKIIFKSELSGPKESKSIIDNKFNMKYAENEEQYNLLIKKENLQKRIEGKKIKIRNVSPYIQMKLDDAQDKINFMKDVMDYTYPLFVLTKIKEKQKNLREMKRKRNIKNLNYINEKDRRILEIKAKNQRKTQYLLKSFSFLK